MNSYVEEVKKETGCKEAKLFASQGKFRFQLEFPETFSVDEDEYILSSTVKGKCRYMT